MADELVSLLKAICQIANGLFAPTDSDAQTLHSSLALLQARPQVQQINLFGFEGHLQATDARFARVEPPSPQEPSGHPAEDKTHDKSGRRRN